MEKGGYVRTLGEKDGFWSIDFNTNNQRKGQRIIKGDDHLSQKVIYKARSVSVDPKLCLDKEMKAWNEEYLESGGTIVAADPSAVMEDLNQTYGYESVYEKGGVTPKAHIQKLANDLWDRKGYDLTYLEKLSEKELKSLWDTEFFYEDEFFEKGGRLGFEGLAKKVAKRYEGKAVKPKFQEEYGKTYSKEEAMEVGRKVAAKVYGQQTSQHEEEWPRAVHFNPSLSWSIMQNAIKSIRDEWKSKKTDAENGLDQYSCISERSRTQGIRMLIKFGEEHITRAYKNQAIILLKRSLN